MQKTCIIIPCFNEASRLNLDVFGRYCDAVADVDFCFVDDGSTDATVELLNNFIMNADRHAFMVSCGINRGKAEAVRRGMLEMLATGRYSHLGYLDADLSAPLTEIIHFKAMFHRRKRARFVLGTRFRHMGVRIVRNTGRHYLGRIFSTCSSMLLDLPVYDTQCGAKMLLAETAAALFDEPFVTRWLFDVELLARMMAKFGRRYTLASVVELPLREWIEKRGSRLGLRQAVTIPIEMMRIRSRYFSRST